MKTPPCDVSDDLDLEELEELERRAYAPTPRWAKWLCAGVAVFGLGLGWLVVSGGDTSTGPAGESLAARGCVKAAQALEEYEHGTRSLPSTLDALRGQEGDLRDAAALDAKYAPLARAVIAAQAELAAGRPGVAGVGVLLANCGSQRTG